MSRKHFGEQFAFASDNKALIIEGIISCFLDQRSDFGFLEEELIEPGDLREHLEISEILRLKIFFGTVRRLAGAAETLPQFAVARVATDHVDRVRLKEILQGKAALVRGEVFGWFGCNVEKGIARSSSDVILNLRDQTRNKIEILVDIGELVEKLHHSVIIF